ncbi:MAG: hypothetical protein PHN69_01970 [Candidatus Pacebacteria bacterium]|nr:hypothetical protein [Candidatus Paceibacterota bacterium]
MKSLNSLKNNFSVDKEKVCSFCKKCEFYFKSRLISIIGYGSFFNKKDYHDLDLVIILNKRELEDILIIKKFLKSVGLKLKVDINIVGKTEFFSDSSYFSQRTQGCYFIEVLKKGYVLFGNNFYKEFFTKIDKKSYIISILAKIRQYNYEMINYYLNNNDNYIDNDIEIIKKINKIILDIKLVDKNIYNKLIIKFKKVIKEKDQEKIVKSGIDFSLIASNLLYHFILRKYPNLKR